MTSVVSPSRTTSGRDRDHHLGQGRATLVLPDQFGRFITSRAGPAFRRGARAFTEVEELLWVVLVRF